MKESYRKGGNDSIYVSVPLVLSGHAAMRIQRALFVPASISDIKDISTLAALFEVDSNYGRWTERRSGRRIPASSSAAARFPQILQKRQKLRSEVHAGYTEQH
jgi:hypothetical protein